MSEPARTDPWTVASVLRWATDDFRGRGIASPRLDAELLLGMALGFSRTQLVMELPRPLAPDELARFRDLVRRRRTHEPVAYILGVREFYGRAFRVDRRVLVPRPDTETLVEVALERTRHVSLSMRALDLCTGSGCVALTLARERPTSCVWATDLSDDALAVARDNALRLGAYNVVLCAGDLFEPARGRHFDVVTANPPYIPDGDIASLDADVRAHEPRMALSGGDDGLVLIRRIVQDAPTVLVAGGALAMEVGAGQAADVASLFEARGFVDVRLAKDYARIDRVVHGVFRP